MKRIILPIVILLAGFGLAALIVATGPTLESQAPPPSSPLVRTWVAEAQAVRLATRAHGTVLPRTESELVPEVAGRIVRISPAMVSGGFFKANDVLFEIDPLDYELALEQARAGVASASSEFQNAQRAHTRQQDLAQRQSTSESLRDEALNRLHVARAGLRQAQAQLARAERDLARTQVRAPYDGRVRTERVDVGQFVNRGASVATIYAIDYAEVRLPVHDEELAYLDLALDQGMSEQRPTALLRAAFAGQEHSWEGTIVRTEGELDPQTRMINLVARVDAPYETIGDRPPLAVGLFVEAAIQGPMVNNVFVLPRSALQNNDQLYVVREDNTLEFRNAEILRIVEEDVYVTGGLTAGDVVVLSTVTNAVPGMAVRPVRPTEAVSTAYGGEAVGS